MAGIENYVAAAVVQARFVSTDFTRLTEHPVLQRTVSINVSGISTLQACLRSMILTDAITKKSNFAQKRENILFNKIHIYGNILLLYEQKSLNKIRVVFDKFLSIIYFLQSVRARIIANLFTSETRIFTITAISRDT